jgi:hypothetical protein
MKKILRSLLLSTKMGWIDPKNHFHTAVPLTKKPNREKKDWREVGEVATMAVLAEDGWWV